MNKVEQTDQLTMLLGVIEHPEHYTDEQLTQLLRDETNVGYYRLMCDAASAYAVSHTENEAEVEAAWQTFAHRTSLRYRYVLKAAAVFLAILMLSGISYAAIRLLQGNHETSIATPETTIVPSVTVTDQDTADSVLTFQNAELQEVLKAITTHYHLQSEFRNEDARHVRLYMKWNRNEDVEMILERLNRFEKVNITLVSERLIVE